MQGILSAYTPVNHMYIYTSTELGFLGNVANCQYKIGIGLNIISLKYGPFTYFKRSILTCFNLLSQATRAFPSKDSLPVVTLAPTLLIWILIG